MMSRTYTPIVANSQLSPSSFIIKGSHIIGVNITLGLTVTTYCLISPNIVVPIIASVIEPITIVTPKISIGNTTF